MCAVVHLSALWPRGVPIWAVAADAFHPALDRYGVWPGAIHAAARRGVLGYLLRFPDWSAAAWCLDRGLPVIASIRYGPGELTGAPLRSADSGHLIVLTGYDNDEVLVRSERARGRRARGSSQPGLGLVGAGISAARVGGEGW